MANMATSGCYTSEYFSRIRVQSQKSAAVIAPQVMELLHPRSVVDVGCGTGAWAAAFKAAGATEILGIDGAYCDPATLEIDAREFHAADLTQPIELPRRFDLAVCLEVAEHLDERYARSLVTSLTQIAPLVLFSAAIPFQGGEHHVNEQWPSYWAAEFARQEFLTLDPFRRRLWSQPAVAWWYAQNMLLFVHRDAARRLPGLSGIDIEPPSSILSLVHPDCLMRQTWRNQVLEAVIDLMSVTAPDAHILLVDNAQFGELPQVRRMIAPFPERNGLFSGPPVDSSAAIAELEGRHAVGANTIAFGWPAFWWMEYYKDFTTHLQAHFSELLSNERIIVFERNDD